MTNEFIYNINNNLSLVKSNLTNGLFELYSIGSILGLNIDKLFEELHISNMTMLCSENDASRLMFKETNKVKNLSNIEIHKSNLENYYILYNKSTGEILLLFHPLFLHFLHHLHLLNLLELLIFHLHLLHHLLHI